MLAATSSTALENSRRCLLGQQIRRVDQVRRITHCHDEIHPDERRQLNVTRAVLMQHNLPQQPLATVRSARAHPCNQALRLRKHSGPGVIPSWTCGSPRRARASLAATIAVRAIQAYDIVFAINRHSPARRST